MHDEGGHAVHVNHAGVGQQAAAALLLELRADQKVAVAVHHEHRRAALHACVQGAGDSTVKITRIVIAQPGLEQITEDVQRIGAARLLFQKPDEALGGVRALFAQVQVGYE